jgi:hypothetical protein
VKQFFFRIFSPASVGGNPNRQLQGSSAMMPTRRLLVNLRNAFRVWVAAQIAAPGWDMFIVKAPFTPGLDLAFSTLVPDADIDVFPVLWNDTGYQEGTDPRDGSILVTFHAGLGGIQASQSTLNTPRNWYGWAVEEHASAGIMICSELLPASMSVAQFGDQLRHPDCTFRLPLNLIR